MAGLQTFQEVAFGSGKSTAAQFESYAARCLRYSVNWAYYENTQYIQVINSWAEGMKTKVPTLYKHIRSIYNPVQRVGDFWQAAIWRGSLSPTAADEGAIPIKIGDSANEKTLRPLIAQVNKWSNWDANKDVHTLYGSVLGDALIYIREDRERQQVRTENVHPSELANAQIDNMGFVKAYTIEYMRIDNDGKSAKYRETCRHLRENESLYNTDGTLVTGKPWILFETYRDGNPYVWDGNPSTNGENWWVTDWGFCGLVLTKHIDIGLDFGYCEFHAQSGKINEQNDQASLLNDQIRKSVNAKWGVTGAKPTGTIRKTATTPTADRPEPEREEENIIYLGEGAVVPMVAPVDVAQVLTNIQAIQAEIENDLPELKQEVWAGGSGPSDSTILAARGRVEGKVQKRRNAYDTGYIRAMQMAITVGALAGYEGFTVYNGESYANGELDFSISERPAFPPQPSEERAKMADFWNGWAALETNGVTTFRSYASSYGMSEQFIADYEAEQLKRAKASKTAVGL